MAKKYKVVGQKNLTQRIPNANTFESKSSTSLFATGTFKLTTNLMPAAISNYESRLIVKRTLVSLEDLRIKSLDHAKLISDVTSKLVLNTDKSNLNSYACFGSLKEMLRVSVSNIINKWPGSLYVDPSYVDATQSFITVANYAYNAQSGVSNFDINTTLINNSFGINFNNTIITDNPKNLIVNYKDFVVKYNGQTFGVFGFTGTTSATPTTVNISVVGDVFSDRPTNTTTSLARTFHISPNETQFSVFYATLGNLEKYLLTPERETPYEAVFRFPGEDNDGNVEFFDIPVAWPVSDGYNLDNSGSRFDIYLNSLLGLGQGYDDFKTNLIIRQLIPNSYLQLDYTTSSKGEKLLAIYGRQFDEIKAFIDGLVYVNTVTYSKTSNAPDAIIYNLAQTLGWETFPFVEEQDLLESIFGTATTTSNQKSFSPTEVNIELWRRIIINTGYLLRSKGTRQAIEAIFSMIGAPEALIEINEHVFLTDRVVKIGDTTRNTLQFDTFINDTYGETQYAYPNNIEGIAFESTYEHEFTHSLEDQGFSLKRVVDNKKSWINADNAQRTDEGLLTDYTQGEQATLINSKQMSLSLNIAKALNYSGYEIAINTPDFAGVTFMQFLAKINNLIPARSHKTVLNNYPTLTALYENYRQAYPSKIITQPHLLDIIKKINGSWNRLLTQMLPATTILNERGVTISNSVFTPQKFNYKRGIDAGSTHVTKQPERIEDTIFVYKLETGIDEEVNSDIMPVAISADVFNAKNGYLVNSGGLSLLTNRTATPAYSDGKYVLYRNSVMESVVGGGNFNGDITTQNTSFANSAVYRINKNGAKVITLVYPDIPEYYQLLKTGTTVFGYHVFEIFNDFGIYRTTGVARTFIDYGILSTTNRSVTIAIPNGVLKPDSQYIVSPFFKHALSLDIVPYKRTYPMDYHDSYAQNEYDSQWATSPKYYNRNNAIPQVEISTEKIPEPNAVLANVAKSDYDIGFITISSPDKPILNVQGQTINPITPYTQNVTIIANSTTEIALQYEPIGPVSASLNGTILSGTQFVNSTLYSNDVNKVVYVLNVVTVPSDSLIITYYSGKKPVTFMQDSLLIGSTGLTATNTILLQGVIYTTMTLTEVPLLSSIKINVGSVLLSPAAMVPGTTNTIYFPYSTAIVPQSQIMVSYLKIQTSNVDFLTIETPILQSIGWTIPNLLPNPAYGLFRFDFVGATDVNGNKIVPDFTTPIYSSTSRYIALTKNFTKAFAFASITEIASFEFLYFRIASKKDVTAFGTAGTFSEEIIGDTYMIRKPGQLVAILSGNLLP